MKIEVKKLTGTARTVTGMVDVDGCVSSLKDIPVQLGDNQTKREQALINAALTDQGKEAIND